MTKSQRFNRAVEAFILSKGGSAQPATGLYRFVLPTRAGTLCVHPSDNWIACRFENVDAAKRVLGADGRLNPYSGKWNFTCAVGGKINGDAAFAAFKEELEPLLTGLREAALA